MEKLIEFLDHYYVQALKLCEDFRITREKEWTSLTILNELSIQIGHIYNVLYQSEVVFEAGRIFDNLGDEISDVVLQLIALATSLNIDLYHIKNMNFLKEENIFSISILFGQLTEAIMEKNGYRFSKKREGFQTIDLFIEDRLLRLFSVIFQFALKYSLDIEQEFFLMLEDARGFLKRFFNKQEVEEYIDTYNENHEFITKMKRDRAHQLGLWHDVVGCLILNPYTKNVFFQLKKGLSKDDLLEITVGGHLQAGEDISDVIREVREEAGLDVCFSDMIFCKNRKCDYDRGVLIREFQHYYLLPLAISLEDFHPKDEEALSFIQLNIDDARHILHHSTWRQGKVLLHKNSISCGFSKNNFDPAFLQNGVFECLLKDAKKYLKAFEKEHLKKDKKLKKQLVRIYKVTSLQRLFYPNDYYYNNSRLLNSFDQQRENIFYTVIFMQKEYLQDAYLVYVLIEFQHIIIWQQLKREFSKKEEAEEYFHDLCCYVKTADNLEIIKHCYLEILKFPSKNLFHKILVRGILHKNFIK